MELQAFISTHPFSSVLLSMITGTMLGISLMCMLAINADRIHKQPAFQDARLFGDFEAEITNEPPVTMTTAEQYQAAVQRAKQHCPPCNGNCNQGRNCPAAAIAKEQT